MKYIMVIINPMTLFMVLFLIYGVRSLRRKERVSAVVCLLLFASLAFNTVLLCLRVR
ncbi:MAG: hypothetical protein WCS52_19390 [bacterium]|jgi:purine-cytosine permease-like protein